MIKKVLAIHDISCFGKCSLSVVLPLLSAASIETTILPTAILSTHTGGYQDFTFRDLSDDLMPIIKHWQSLNLEFDGIYTGYLGSIKQIEIIEKIFDIFKTANNQMIVDPVMGDNGKLYTNFDMEFVSEMKKLCAKADIITPNITEACFMLDVPYLEKQHSKEYINDILIKLSELGPKKIVLTGIRMTPGKIGVATYDKTTNKFYTYFNDYIDGFFHGSGDVYSSALVAGIINELTLESSSQLACRFIVKCIESTKVLERDNRQGIAFEENIPLLIDLLNAFKNKAYL